VDTAPAGTSTYDLVFNDVANRDAAYAKYVLGQSHAFWDQQNVTQPDSPLGAVPERGDHDDPAAGHRLAGPARQPVVSIRGQHRRHYQDNKAEYFFATRGELRAAGAIAVLFGQATDGSTTNTDAEHDGVTNPPEGVHQRRLSSGTVCNTNVAPPCRTTTAAISAPPRPRTTAHRWPLG